MYQLKGATMPTIRIDDDIFESLKAMAEPFVDTPNTVIRRILEEHGVLKKPTSKPGAGNTEAKATKKHSEVSSALCENFLHVVLATRFHGEGDKNEITAAVVELLKAHGYVGPEDMELVSTGETKVANRIAWARNALKDKGIIARTSPRGVWALTKGGFNGVKDISLPRAANKKN